MAFEKLSFGDFERFLCINDVSNAIDLGSLDAESADSGVNRPQNRGIRKLSFGDFERFLRLTDVLKKFGNPLSWGTLSCVSRPSGLCNPQGHRDVVPAERAWRRRAGNFEDISVNKHRYCIGYRQQIHCGEF